jgi:trimeric autotransporter adhesin
MFGSISGSSNAAIGAGAGGLLTTGDNNIALGFQAGISVTTASNVIAIGDVGENVDNSCYIGNILIQPSPDALPVLVGFNNKLGTMASSKRLKKDVKPMNKTSEMLFSLKPVTFRYKNDIDPANRAQFGLVAEDVEKVNPDLVVRDKNGEIYTVRYDAVNAMLLNEFLKEHRKVQELQATAAHQQRQIEALTAGLQKVRTEIELSKLAPQTVLNDQ